MTRVEQLTTIVERMEDDLDWDELMLYVRDGRVVPVIGNDLLRVEIDGRMATIESVLARDLARELGIELPAERELRLSQVASRYLQDRGPAKRLYPKLKVVLERRQFEVPPVLRQLAAIRGFQLVLTTSFAPLLVNALDEVRFGGRSETEVLAFSPYSRPGDLRSPASVSGTCVYHLFGIASSMPEYVITDEDLIEFMHGLQSDRRPQNLFEYLRTRHLLFLGCGYTNWLARFFIRALRNERFASGNPQKSEVIVDEIASGDAELTLFLRQYDSQVFRSLQAPEFVDQLHRRWTTSERGSGKPQPPYVRAMPAEAVFLSYAREDVEHIRKVATAFEDAGIDAWLEERRLEGGDTWDAVIQENIRRCSLFVPFISRNTEAASEGYFRFEWQLALRRALRMAPTRPFIVPVSLDETTSAAPNVPPELGQWQWVRLAESGGIEALTNLVRRTVRLLRAPQYVAPASSEP
jgi:hypothetical protein